MIRLRKKYWNIGRFADFVRGTPKPFAETAEGWEEWRVKAKQKRFRYWLVEEFFVKAQNVLYYPHDFYEHCASYLRNRFVNKTHTLQSSLKTGWYYDLDTRILWCNFDSFKFFVERELGGINNVIELEQKEATEHGNEIIELYKWWTEIRPSRQEVGEISGWNDLCAKGNFSLSFKSVADEAVFIKILDKMNHIESEYETEDTDMLIRLIKVRSMLWT